MTHITRVKVDPEVSLLIPMDWRSGRSPLLQSGLDAICRRCHPAGTCGNRASVPWLPASAPGCSGWAVLRSGRSQADAGSLLEGGGGFIACLAVVFHTPSFSSLAVLA